MEESPTNYKAHKFDGITYNPDNMDGDTYNSKKLEWTKQKNIIEYSLSK